MGAIAGGGGVIYRELTWRERFAAWWHRRGILRPSYPPAADPELEPAGTLELDGTPCRQGGELEWR
jgi:hypothetical protein